MTFRTVWNRLEPWARDEDLQAGLEARVHDPLWLLGRQWQLGEFMAEDTGSPIRVEVDVEATPSASYLPRVVGAKEAASGGIAYDPRSLPVEALAEGERPGLKGESNWVLAAHAGLDFLEALGVAVVQDERKKLLDDLRAAFPIPSPTPEDIERWGEDRLRTWVLLAQRAPDGGAIYALLKKRDGIKQILASVKLARELEKKVKAAIEEWNTIYKPLLEASGNETASWVTERLQYGFSVGVGSGAAQTVLTAADHHGGRLDWTSFDIADGATLTSSSAATVATTKRTIVATPSAVQVSGIPNQRYWELEDGAVNFGAVEASTLDLPRLLFLQFGLVFGNDFFLVPVSVPVGSLCRTTRFEVWDTFGEKHTVNATNPTMAAGETWRMFGLTGEKNKQLWLPAVLPGSCQGSSIEVVRLARDEAANLTWGIEAVVEDPLGRGMSRRDLEIQPPSTEAPVGTEPGGEILFYNALSTPPPSWVPLRNVVPKLVTDPVNVLAAMTSAGWGRILRGVQAARLLEEAVPREGVEVCRRFEHSRWIDGRSVLWLGRSRTVGRGEVDSGVRFDFITQDR